MHRKRNKKEAWCGSGENNKLDIPDRFKSDVDDDVRGNIPSKRQGNTLALIFLECLDQKS